MTNPQTLSYSLSEPTLSFETEMVDRYTETRSLVYRKSESLVDCSNKIFNYCFITAYYVNNTGRV